MTTQEYMELGDKYFVHTYNRYKIVMDKAKGVYIYDADGKKYLDFASGIGVASLGYGNKKYTDAIKSQIDKIMHTSNLFYNEPAVLAAEKLVKASGLEKAFFTNSGAEAIEGALKMAKRYAYDRDGKSDHEIIAMGHSFHGRTMGALALTGNEHYQKPFGPMISGIKFAEYNDLDSVKALVNDKTCAIILEPVQGEGGIYPADKEFIEGIRKICDEKDILMICDEVQCGMGRTGEMFAFQNYNVKPDIIASAKALGCGVPVGAFVAGKKCCNSLVPGDHGTTYGEILLLHQQLMAVFDIYEEENILENVKNVGAYLEKKLDELVNENKNIVLRRGKGLMQGLVLKTPVGDTINKAIEKGLLVISAAGNVLRLLPPLIITKENVDEMINILKECI